MVEDYRNMVNYLFADALLYYLLPLLIRDTGSGMFVLLVAMPLGLLIVSILYGRKYKMHFGYIVLAALLFVPAVFLYYNATALIYVNFCGILALIGNLIGSGMHRRKRQREARAKRYRELKKTSTF